MVGAFIVLGLLPWLTPKLVIKSSVFRPITRILFWFIFVDFLLDFHRFPLRNLVLEDLH